MRRLIHLVTVAALFLGSVLSGQDGGADEARVIRAVAKAFKKSKRPVPVAERLAVVARLGPFDSVAVAKVLVKAYSALQVEFVALDLRRRELNEEFLRFGKKNVKGKNPRSMQAVKADMAVARAVYDALGEQVLAVSSILTELRREASIEWLLESVSGKRKYPLRLKIKVARAAGATGVSVLPVLVAVLKKLKDPAEVAAVLDGVGIMGEAAREAAPQILPLLQHKSEMVREHAALALSTLCDPAAIEPMIVLLGASHGQSKKRVAAYLEALTRQQHGTSVTTWRRWFAVEGAKFLAGKMPLGGGAPSSRKKGSGKKYYFGIPQDGRSIIYIIDASNSMKQKIKLRIPPPEDPPAAKPRGRTVAKLKKKKGDDTGEGDGGAKTTTRLEACKAELIRALGRLPATTRFNVIWYSDIPHMHQFRMRKAEPKRIAVAQEWVRKLTPKSSTNIHDSLEMAFMLTGLASRGKIRGRGPVTGPIAKPESIPDTIFLLTDGVPTIHPGVKLDSTDKIIKAVREWNALKAVVVHTIGIGKGVNATFLRRLAKENGGEFRQY